MHITSLKTLPAVLALVSALAATAQTAPDSVAPIIADIEASGRVSISQPAALTPLLMRVEQPDTPRDEAKTSPATTPTARQGYRVQVFDDNNPLTARREAEARHRLVETEFPHMRAYLTFNSPYWRVKVGDFRTRAEAEAALAELRHAFPAMSAYMRIVRDKINISD